MRRQVRVNGEGVQEPLACCVIDPCGYSRECISELMRECCRGEVLALADATAYVDLPVRYRIQPFGVMVFSLPQGVAAMLDSLLFLRHLLLRQVVQNPPALTRVVLLASQETRWLYDTLHALLGHRLSVLDCITLLDSRCRPDELCAALCAPAWRPEPAANWGGHRGYSHCKPLSLAEVRVLCDTLYHEIPITRQAQVRGMSAKTLYSQRRDAMQKLNVQTFYELLHWGGGAADWVALRGRRTDVMTLVGS